MVMRLLPALQLWIFLTCRIINYFVESLEMINHKQWYFKCFEWFFVTWPEPNTLSILVSCLTSCYCLMSGSCQHWLPDESKQMADAIHLRIGFQMSCKLEHGLESWSPSNFQFSKYLRHTTSCIQPQDVFVIKCRSNSAHTKLIICTSYFSAAWCHLSNSHQPRFLFVRGAEHFSLLPHSWCENSKFGVILTISEAAVADICRGNW